MRTTTEFRVTYAPGATYEQAQQLENELQGYHVKFTWQIAKAIAPEVTAAVVLALCFAAKSFFDGFLKELGKDTYGWLKARTGIDKAKKVSDLNVRYRVDIGDITFSDDSKGTFHKRHERILETVHRLHDRVTKEQLWDVVSVELDFDDHLGQYVEARCYTMTGRFMVDGEVAPPPIRVYKL